ncbi:adenylylsulfate kinase [Rubritalea squalenifaciens DSM 18772]|uniref:Adenylyl-sulfate kinase n=1 Tax=Rubritalea squalenifaciens DSM 18772 TaxID=1123071 RepID=A0A1M6DFI3_9BACT|nr:adenylyl-sulfate kinase [Rubritalea squalenifaciens]SHI71920.1 adenylylsulfate kinase [Rubritalea squalenifaciens DSM 18772]
MTNIYPEFERQIPRQGKEELLKQKGQAIWLYGLSGSGKSTIANALEKLLHEQGRYVVMVDGDNLRSGLNAGLGFTDEDREENIRRASEVVKLLVNNGAIVLVTLITPQEKFRAMAREIVGTDDLKEVYVKASFEACQQRDVKGLYAKAAAGGVKNFSGKTSNFEEPETPDLTINTEESSVEESVAQVLKLII